MSFAAPVSLYEGTDEEAITGRMDFPSIRQVTHDRRTEALFGVQIGENGFDTPVHGKLLIDMVQMGFDRIH